jgi:hypothetical protein
MMNKKQLLSAISVLSIALSVEVEVANLDVPDLEKIHDDLTAKKEAIKKQEKVVLVFKGPYKRYSNGDIAGFNADVAERILKLKPAIAVEYQPKTDED